MNPDTGHLVREHSDKLSSDYERLPDELNRVARRKLAGKDEAHVSLTFGGKLSKWAAKQRKARAKMARASGTPVQEGVVAVDKDVVPLGSRVYIESDFPDVTGWYRAEDTGSAIQGNRIDIFRESRKTALAFGKREVRVVIVK